MAGDDDHLMTSTKTIMATAAALGVLLLSSGAAAEPPTPEPCAEGSSVCPLPRAHVVLTRHPGLLGLGSTIDGVELTHYSLPLGTHILAPPAWSKLDAEMRRLQDAETRLTAENQSLRTQAGSGWRPGWKLLATTLVIGTALGAYGRSKL